MMSNRTIKFRAKRIDRSEWIVGDYVRRIISGTLLHYITLPDMYDLIPVHPETVGQFTGLHDKNGNEIYEGDKLRWLYEYSGTLWKDSSKFVNDPIPQENIVMFYNGEFRIGYDLPIIAVNNQYYQTGDNQYMAWRNRHFDFEIIGSIHTHPDQLGLK